MSEFGTALAHGGVILLVLFAAGVVLAGLRDPEPWRKKAGPVILALGLLLLALWAFFEVVW